MPLLKGADVQLIENQNGELNWNTSILMNKPKPENEQPLNLKNLLSFSEINLEQAKIKQQKDDVGKGYRYFYIDN